MKHLRSDYDSIQPFPQKRSRIVLIDGEKVDTGPDSPDHIRSLGKHMEPIIPEDEPVFLLRAQDPSARIAVRAWADDVDRRGGDMELTRRVRQWADEMDDYAYSHCDKEVADVPEGALREVL